MASPTFLANALNNQTWIVGTSTTGSGTNHAFLWRNGAMQNLNDLIAIEFGLGADRRHRHQRAQ